MDISTTHEAGKKAKGFEGKVQNPCHQNLYQLQANAFRPDWLHRKNQLVAQKIVFCAHPLAPHPQDSLQIASCQMILRSLASHPSAVSGMAMGEFVYIRRSRKKRAASRHGTPCALRRRTCRRYEARHTQVGDLAKAPSLSVAVHAFHPSISLVRTKQRLDCALRQYILAARQRHCSRISTSR